MKQFLITFFGLLFLECVSGESSFIVLGPKVIRRGVKEKICVSLYGKSGPGSVTFSTASYVTNITSLSFKETEISKCTDVRIDKNVPSKVESVTLIFEAELGGDIRYKNITLPVRTKSTITLIQTDKPWYLPGQTVKFRVLLLDHLMKPSLKQIPEVTVHDPNGMVIQRWKQVNVSNTNGIGEFELPLCKEPVQGTWRVAVKRKQRKPVEKQFQVKEYELPRFEVSLSPSVTDKEVHIQICAKYSYGEQVDMKYSLICQPDRNWDPIYIPKEGGGLGCAIATISKSELKEVEDEYFDTKLNFFVKVTEVGTGVTINGTTKVILKATGFRIEFTKKSEIFHVGIPYSGEGLVFKGGQPVAHEKGHVQLCIEALLLNDDRPAINICERINLTAGRFKFSFLPKDGISQYKITAKRHLKGKDPYKAEYITKQVISPSNSSLVLLLEEKNYKCNETVKLNFYVNGVGDNVDLHYYIVGRGDVLEGRYESQLRVKQQNLNFQDMLNKATGESVVVKMISTTTFKIKPTFSPEFQVLAFFVTSKVPREIVTASGKFMVESCYNNTVEMNWNSTKTGPGKRVGLSVSAPSGSVCGLMVVDKSVTFLDPEQQLKKEDVFTELSNLKIGPEVEPLQKTPDNKYCTKNNTQSVDTDYFADYDDEDGCFACESLQVDSIASFDEVGLFVMSDIQMEHRNCKLEFTVVPRMLDTTTDGDGYDSDSKTSNLELRSYFPETWLWELFPMNDSKLEKSYKAPHTITDWKGKTICLHNESGFGMSDDADLRVYQDFFIDFTLPYSVKRGETLALKVSVFNYKEYDIEVELTLNHLAPVLNANTKNITISPKRKEVHTFEIQPTTIGMMKIEVQAIMTKDKKTKRTKDIVQKELRVVPEGVMVEKTETTLVCQSDNNNTLIWKQEPPRDVVVGSERAWITASGDLMGAALSDLDNLVSLPTGCGEQNMVKFAPIVYVLKYLNATDQDDEELEGTAKKFLNIGYQRQLKYLHDDGSYSAFGKYDETGSMWLTAFVVRSFATARQFIPIDGRMKKKSIDWILGQQNKTTGCFPVVGKLITGGLNGGVGKGGSEEGLTAYVLTSLLESPVMNKTSSRGQLDLARKCILGKFEPTRYEESLITYALLRYAVWMEAADEGKSKILGTWKEGRKKLEQLLNARSKSEGLAWWEDASQSKALSIEMTAYNILSINTFLKHRPNKEGSSLVNLARSTARSAVLWLAKQRNSDGGFISTQDTVIGLQALASYATDLFSKEVDIKADLKWRSNKDDRTIINITEENRLLLQKHEFSSMPSDMRLNVEAISGCGLFQMILRYNIPKPTEETAFNVSSVICDIDGKKKALVGYVQYQKGETSNMAVVDVEVPSGYIADKKSLLKLQDDESTAIKRAEYEKGHVNLYFDEVKDTRTKFFFALHKEHDVRDVKPALTVAYDYYTPEKRGSVEWSIVEIGGEECNDLGSL